MSAWQFTHGRARGAYQRIGDTELYIRQHLAADGMPSGSWSLYVDGRLEGTADRELTAKAAAEAAARAVVVGAGAAGVAAAAGRGDRAA